jgi:hypothetical protein
MYSWSDCRLINKLSILLLAITAWALLPSSLAHAQYTVVSAQVHDPNGALSGA